MEIKKVAVLIGLNYRGTANELPDCELDVDNIEKNLLVGFDVVEKYYEMSPRQFQGIIEKYSTLKAEDTFLLCYSGHGTTIPSSAEKDKTQEGLVFFEKEAFYVLKDIDLKRLLGQLQCNVIQHFDSCFSAGMRGLVAQGIPRFKFFHFKDIVFDKPLPKLKNSNFCF